MLQRVGGHVIPAEAAATLCVHGKYICAVVFLSCGHGGVAQQGMRAYSLRPAPDITQS